MNISVINDYYGVLESFNIFGINSINYLLFYISIFKTNKFNKIINQNDLDKILADSNSSYDIINGIRNKISNKYGIFNFDFPNNETLLSKMSTLTMSIDITNINLKTLINDCFTYYINNDNLNVIKDYIKFYNNPDLNKWICNFVDITQSNKILDANCKINSFYDELKNRKLNASIYGNQLNHNIRTFQILNNIFIYGDSYKEDIGNLDPLINDSVIGKHEYYDLIFLDMPNGIHNVIHAQCCSKIKKLKLRGTKAEPLLLQWVMSTLNKNGKALLIVPDSLLFSDSLQPIETREYLIKNFNVKKIIQIDENIYWGNNITKDLKSQSSIQKNSLVYFENNGKTTNVEFSKLAYLNNKIGEYDVVKINEKIFNAPPYTLYLKKYLELENAKNESIQMIKVSDLFIFNNKNHKGLAIGLSKYWKSDQSVQVINDKKISNFDIIISEKTTVLNGELFEPEYLLHYLEYKIKSEPEKFTKGKMNQFSIDKIANCEIPIIEKSKQKAICSYLSITNKLIEDNNDKIKLYENLISCLIETIPNNKQIKLKQIVNLYQLSDIHDNVNNSNLIGIIKNGLSAGYVYLPSGELSNNSHYLEIKDKDLFLPQYIFRYLKHNQSKLMAIANTTTQPNLTKSPLLDFTVSSIDIDNQKYLCTQCDVFTNEIIKSNKINESIKEKDILSTVIKLNNI